MRALVSEKNKNNDISKREVEISTPSNFESNRESFNSKAPLPDPIQTPENKGFEVCQEINAQEDLSLNPQSLTELVSHEYIQEPTENFGRLVPLQPEIGSQPLVG